MNLFAKVLTAAFFISVFVSNSQTRLSGQWSLILNGNINGNFGTSAAMNGSKDDFFSDLSVDYNNRKFPFGEDATKSANFGGMLSYGFNESPVSINASFNYYMFTLGENSFSLDHATMNIITLSTSLEYTVGEPSKLWNVFGRAGINFNFIAGEVEYFLHKTKVNPAFRLGGELEIGGRLNIPSTPLALELSAAYINANLIGKSYTRFSERPPQELDERELNDGKNPDNPGDINRTIDFITLKGGIRLWF